MLDIYYDALGEHKEGGEMSNLSNLLNSIREWLFSKEDEEQLFEEVGVVTPNQARDPITQSRLKAMVPPNSDLVRRQEEVTQEIASADEAGVVRK